MGEFYIALLINCYQKNPVADFSKPPDFFMIFLKAFLVGGLICAIGQILMDTTKLTPARILVAFVVSGVILGALGLYEPLVEWAGSGAAVPLTGFGHSLCQGVIHSVQERGWIGAFCGGLTATAGGIAAAIFFGTLVALVSKPRMKGKSQ